MIFQGLGARYSFAEALRHLFCVGVNKDIMHLQQMLGEKYGGQVVLYRKGRTALAEAIRLASGGDGKVAISALTCYNVVQAVEAAGCRPVFVDIRQQDLHFGVDELKQRLREHPDIKVVVIQNMLGYPVDIEGLEELAKAHNLSIIEDLAHSAGAHYQDGREVGTVGDLTMMSFGRDKVIDAGGGGALIVRNSGLGEAATPSKNPPLFDQFRDRIYPITAWVTRKLYKIKIGRYIMSASIRLRLVSRSADGEPDSKQKLPNWQAKLASREIANLQRSVAHRYDTAKLYQERLADIALINNLSKGASPLRVPVLVEDRKELLKWLWGQGAQIYDTWYDAPVAPIRFYERANFPEADNPVAVEVAAKIINLPVHSQITKQDVIKITKLLAEGVKGG